MATIYTLLSMAVERDAPHSFSWGLHKGTDNFEQLLADIDQDTPRLWWNPYGRAGQRKGLEGTMCWTSRLHLPRELRDQQDELLGNHLRPGDIVYLGTPVTSTLPDLIDSHGSALAARQFWLSLPPLTDGVHIAIDNAGSVIGDNPGQDQFWRAAFTMLREERAAANADVFVEPRQKSAFFRDFRPTAYASHWHRTDPAKHTDAARLKHQPNDRFRGRPLLWHPDASQLRDETSKGYAALLRDLRNGHDVCINQYAMRPTKGGKTAARWHELARESA